MGPWQIVFELVWCFIFTLFAHLANADPIIAIVCEFLAVLPISITACKLTISNAAHNKLFSDVCSQAREAFVETCKKEGLILSDATTGDFSIRFFIKKSDQLVCHEIDSVCVTKLNALDRKMHVSCNRQSPESIIAEVFWNRKTLLKTDIPARIWGDNITPNNIQLFESLHSKLAVIAAVYDNDNRFTAIVVVDSSRSILNADNNKSDNDRFESLCRSLGHRIWNYYSTVKHIRIER